MRRGRRKDDDLYNLPPGQAFKVLTNALYDDHGQSDEQVEADELRYRPIAVKPIVSVFDPWDIFLIEGSVGARLLWRMVDAKDEPRECSLLSGEFETVLEAFLAALPAFQRT